MDDAKMLEVIDRYRQYFKSSGISCFPFFHKERLSEATTPHPHRRGLEHCHSMLGEMEKFVREGRLEKAFRWLGFIQGCLWMAGHMTINELRDHNRPDQAESEEVE